ncbi:MAG: hypothetical protein N2234_04780 [Planctomycetota bacterium]|nr:hypothetical protein [Planctomycetota bacterium]
MPNGLSSEQIRIGRILLAEGPLTNEYIQEQIRAEGTPSLLGKAVMGSGHISEIQLISTLLSRYRVPKVRLENYPLTKEAISLLSMEDARRFRAVPLGKVGEITCLAIENLFQVDIKVIYQLRKLVGGAVKLFQTTPQDMDAALDKYYPLPKREVVKPVIVQAAEISGLKMTPYEHSQSYWDKVFTSGGPLKATVMERF